MHSDDGKIGFLQKVSKLAQTQNTEMKRIGSNTPLFRGANKDLDNAAPFPGGIGVVAGSSDHPESNDKNKKLMFSWRR